MHSEKKKNGDTGIRIEKNKQLGEYERVQSVYMIPYYYNNAVRLSGYWLKWYRIVSIKMVKNNSFLHSSWSAVLTLPGNNKAQIARY